MEILEHNSTAKMPSFLDEILASSGSVYWGVAWVSRKHLKPMTNEALAMCIRPVLDDAKAARVFHDGEAHFFIVWHCETKKVYKKLYSLVFSTS